MNKSIEFGMAVGESKAMLPVCSKYCTFRSFFAVYYVITIKRAQGATRRGSSFPRTTTAMGSIFSPPSSWVR
jgi:hypothetical protein